MGRILPWACAALLALGACKETGDPGVGDDDDDGWGCDTEQVDLGTDEVSSLGYSAAELLPLVEGSHGAEVLWWDDTTSALAMDFTYRDEAWVLEKTPWGEENAPAGELDWCTTVLVIGVEFTAGTADGRVDVEMVHSVSSSATDQARLQSWPTGAFNSPDGDGTFVLDPDEWDEIITGFYVDFAPAGTSGEIEEIGENFDQMENPVDQTWETVATWTAG